MVSKTKTEEALDFNQSLDGVPNAFRVVELMEHVFPVEHGDFPKYDVSFQGCIL